MKTVLMSMLMAAALIQAPAQANSELSDLSIISMAVGVSLVGGSLDNAIENGRVVVESVEKAGDSVTLVLRDASGATVASVRGTGKAAGRLSLAAGTAVQVTATASGYVLSAAGAVLAFIPNEAGKALVHSSRAGS
ncbi:MAG: hypothetical protein ACLGI6_03890 [Gammaproteobacteria bacterium]